MSGVWLGWVLLLKEVRFEKSSESKVEEYARVAMEFVQQTRAFRKEKKSLSIVFGCECWKYE